MDFESLKNDARFASSRLASQWSQMGHATRRRALLGPVFVAAALTVACIVTAVALAHPAHVTRITSQPAEKLGIAVVTVLPAPAVVEQPQQVAEAPALPVAPAPAAAVAAAPASGPLATPAPAKPTVSASQTKLAPTPQLSSAKLGKALVTKYCTGCHSVATAERGTRSSSAWGAEVDSMVGGIPSASRSALVAYLASL